MLHNNNVYGHKLHIMMKGERVAADLNALRDEATRGEREAAAAEIQQVLTCLQYT